MLPCVWRVVKKASHSVCRDPPCERGMHERFECPDGEMQSDRVHRDVTIRWSAAYDRSVAPIFSHNELFIHANCHCTFAHLANASAGRTGL